MRTFLAALCILFLAACQSTPPPPTTPTPTITWAQPDATPLPTESAETTKSFDNQFGTITVGDQVYLDDNEDGLLIPTINLWNTCCDNRELVCSLKYQDRVVVEALAYDEIHARVVSITDSSCTGWLHKDFLHPF